MTLQLELAPPCTTTHLIRAICNIEDLYIVMCHAVIIVTHPVSVTALTWYEKWWHPVTFWQFTDNKQSAWNNNHHNGSGRGRPHPLTALQWQIFRMKNCVLRDHWLEYVCSHKKYTKNFQYFSVSLDTDVQRSVSNESQYLLHIQGLYNCLRDF